MTSVMTAADVDGPPWDPAAEQSVLGGMLSTPDAIADVIEVLRPDDFHKPAHQTVYEAITDLYGRGERPDPVTVSAELERRGDLARVGGAPYLHTLYAAVATAVNADYHARIVAEKAVLRRLISAGTRITQYATTSGGDDLEELFDRAQAALDAVTTRRGDSETRTVTGLRDTHLADLRELQAGRRDPGLSTGFADLDRALGGGLRPGQFAVVAGRPGLGKSTLAVDIARAVSRAGKTPAIYSLEMSASELVGRITAAEARVRLEHMHTPGRLAADDWRRIDEAHERLAGQGPIVIDDSPGLTVTQIRAKARRLKASGRLDLIVVDYLQLMSSGRRVESRQVEVSEFSRALKLLAKELAVPVIALSQLNRGSEQRADKRPMLSDLRESGALEQDADLVILINRPDAYERDDPRAGEVDLILAKNRSGPTATVTLSHQLHMCRFTNLAH